MTARQHSLFPDSYEVQDAALAALDEGDFERALALVSAARERDPGLVGLDMLASALTWSAGVLGGRRSDPDRLAEAWRALPEGRRRGALRGDSAAFIDQSLARQALRARPPGPFLDAGETVHLGALHLVLGRAAAARELLLETLARGHRARADLWGTLGDACTLAERPEEASACYARALVIAASDVDLHRLRDERLMALFRALREGHPDSVARELLLPEAWLAGALEIPPGNGGIDAALARELLAATADPGPSPERRLRRFSLLLYRDRSREPGEANVDEREEMAELDAGLFGRFMEECRRRGRTGRLGF